MKVGDLVCVVRVQPCCGDARFVGRHFVIPEMRTFMGRCDACGFVLETLRASVDGMAWLRPQVLRVIPPLNELEAEKAVETVNA